MWDPFYRTEGITSWNFIGSTKTIVVRSTPLLLLLVLLCSALLFNLKHQQFLSIESSHYQETLTLQRHHSTHRNAPNTSTLRITTFILHFFFSFYFYCFLGCFLNLNILALVNVLGYYIRIIKM